LNVLHRPGVFAAPVQHWYTYITSENESQYLPAFHQLLEYDYHLGAELRSLRSRKDFLRMVRDFHSFFVGNMHAERPLLKDPFAVFSCPWFSDRLHCQVVITVRHPAGFASSLKRLGWSFDFQNLLGQPLLMRDHLEPERSAMEKVDPGDVVAQAALLWRVIYRVVHAYQLQYPDFRVVRQEDLALDPVAGYRDLYASMGLKFTPRAESIVLGSSSSENPSEPARNKVYSVKLDSRTSIKNWKKRLEPSELARIREITDGVSQFYYSDDTWS
jgi:hypothetical protein